MTFDFSKFLTRREEEQGYCCLLHHHYAYINGLRINNKTQEETPFKVFWLCELRYEKPAFYILNGITGHEAWYVEDLLKGNLFNQEKPGDFFWANSGTPGKWDGLKIHRQQFKELIKQIAVLYGLIER